MCIITTADYVITTIIITSIIITSSINIMLSIIICPEAETSRVSMATSYDMLTVIKK